MNPQRSVLGFSLVELLLVLAIIGILSGIAIPTFLGQRKRARVIGDAQTNARALMMILESRKAENGLYGPNGTYTWAANGTRPGTDLAPSFFPKGNSQMDYSVAVTTAVTYTLTVKDPKLGNHAVLTADQSGAITLDAAYNK